MQPTYRQLESIVHELESVSDKLQASTTIAISHQLTKDSVGAQIWDRVAVSKAQVDSAIKRIKDLGENDNGV